MIISASRRTDIPAFYTEWLMNRLRAGFCTVPNPFNPRQVSRISLKTEDVDCLVFWTRNPQPLLQHLAELDELGHRYYFLCTLVDYPRPIELATPSVETATATFRALSDRVGPQRVVWRYDPILFSEQTGVSYHLERFAALAELLQGYTKRVVVSVVDIYRKMSGRLQELAAQGCHVEDERGIEPEELETLLTSLVRTARKNGMTITSCAEELELERYGIRPGRCVDGGLISEVFGIDPPTRKDPSQRKTCRCVVSRDIGMYDSCVCGCQYCYATSSLERARENRRLHDPSSPSLLGRYVAASEGSDRD